MEDFIELGIEGVDRLVDKHFHKVPNKYIDPHTYRHLHHRNRGEKRSRRGEDEDSVDEVEEDEERGSAARDDDRYDRRSEDSHRPRRRQTDPSETYSSGGYEYVAPPAAAGAAAGYGYDHNGPTSVPRTQPQYVPNPGATQDPHGYANQYLPPPPPPLTSDLQSDRPRRRPDRLLRRSSSQPPGVKEYDRERRREEKERERRRRANSYSDDRWRDLPGTESAGGKKDGGQSNTEKVVLTLLGAAVGGLAVSAVIDRMDKKDKKSDRGEDMRVGGRERERTGGGGRGHRVEGTRRSRKGGGRR
ncbi:uncharacterized protein PAC_10625 [Phialocephala subalpina]|uniref:Uncharacterized protein n=1 Tax=Phialocephala subalpina TaxID=576137 RepID=A0A1L7X6U3_9HELO|nr:uncharacterized protein PAC_10625 [Phialocephala subalpina]